MWYVIACFAVVCFLLAWIMYVTPPGEEDDDESEIVDDLRLSLIAWPQTGSGYGELDSEPQR